MNANRADFTWTLGLMRHAKSDWGDANLSDHDRPLNARGRRDAPRMGRWLSEQGFLPDLILGSTAVRVRETVQGLLSVWSHEPLVRYSKSLYLPSRKSLQEHVRYEAILADGQRSTTTLVIAHNPAMEQWISVLVGAATRMPTAAVALFECDAIDELDSQAPRVKHCIAVGRPKEIKEPG